MIIDRVNLNHLRIFEAVYRTRSMTTAAKELHLTQSGVSQHMKTLESMLEVDLFDRVNQRLVPTAAAKTLYEECTRGLKRIERALWQIKGGERELGGEVAIGMPIEFGVNVVMPMIATFGKMHPRVRFRFVLDFASTMNTKLLSGELDFAFVDEFRMDKRIVTEKVYDEVVALCATEEYLKGKPAYKHHRKWYEELDYIAYQDGEPVLRLWFAHHLQSRHVALDVRARVMDVQAIARLVLSGFGVGALPGHLISKLQKEGHPITIFKGSGQPLKNTISVAYLRDRSQSPACQILLEYLKAQMTKKERPLS